VTVLEHVLEEENPNQNRVSSIDTAFAIALVSTLITLAATVFAWRTAKAARDSMRQQSLQKLFSTFDLASQASLAKPQLLYAVHGLDDSIPIDEATNIAYFSLLMDGFQHFYGQEFNGDFEKMERELKAKPTFLNKLLSISANQDRWQVLKKLYYGNYDLGFLGAVDGIIRFQRSHAADEA
jgi:hypothetical protein